MSFSPQWSYAVQLVADPILVICYTMEEDFVILEDLALVGRM